MTMLQEMPRSLRGPRVSVLVLPGFPVIALVCCQCQCFVAGLAKLLDDSDGRWRSPDRPVCSSCGAGIMLVWGDSWSVWTWEVCNVRELRDKIVSILPAGPQRSLTH